MSAAAGRESASDRGKEPWFLFKVRDDEATEGDEDGILEREPNSVARAHDGRDRGRKRWQPGGWSLLASPRATEPLSPHLLLPGTSATRSLSCGRLRLADLKAAKKTAMPAKIKPQLATLVEAGALTGDNWLNEIKFDGYRMICRIEGRRRHVFKPQRTRLDGTCAALVQAARGLGVGSGRSWMAKSSPWPKTGSSSFQDCRTHSLNIARASSCITPSTCSTSTGEA